jgi:L-lactate utilization protein LutC
MTDREAFLGMVAGALGKQRGRAVAPDVSTHLAEREEETRQAAERVRKGARVAARPLMDALEKSARDAGWVVRRVASHEDAAEAVVDICRAASVRRALTAEMPALERVLVERSLRAAGIDVATAARPRAAGYSEEARMQVREAAFRFDIGITGADYAIAETGSLVLRPRRGLSRLVSLAPPRHIALVELGQVLPSLDELFLLQRQAFLEGDLTSSFNVISGPSKTGDIGATIVQGVHGPVEVHMVLIG